jgi:hypothetical protein
MSIGGGIAEMTPFTSDNLPFIEIGDVADPAVVTP